MCALRVVARVSFLQRALSPHALLPTQETRKHTSLLANLARQGGRPVAETGPVEGASGALRTSLAGLPARLTAGGGRERIAFSSFEQRRPRAHAGPARVANTMVRGGAKAKNDSELVRNLMKEGGEGRRDPS